LNCGVLAAGLRRETDFALSKELVVSASHKGTAAAKRTPDLVAEMVAGVGPVGFDARPAEERTGDLSVRRSSKRPIEGLKDNAEAPSTRFRREMPG